MAQLNQLNTALGQMEKEKPYSRENTTQKD